MRTGPKDRDLHERMAKVREAKIAKAERIVDPDGTLDPVRRRKLALARITKANTEAAYKSWENR